jgi:ComF family protein
MFRDVIQLLFPKTCVACHVNLVKNEQHLCVACLLDLPQTRFHEMHDNALAKTFWGRLPVEQAFAFVYFKKGNAVQHILHEIKYKNNKELAVFVGQYYGSILHAAGIKLDGVVAIPLHSNKLRSRGYNQSELIAEGLAQSLQVPNLSSYVTRVKATETQTKKTRFARWQNVEEVFSLKREHAFVGKHLLLVDDVITTGATIEACGNQLLQASGVKLSVASIAFASN